MCIDTACGYDVSLPGNHLGPRPDDYVDSRLHIWIPRFSYCSNSSVLNGNIPFHNSPVVENERIGYNGVDGPFTARALRLSHSVANDLSASKLHFLAIRRKVLFNLNHKICVGEAHLITHGWPEHLRVGAATHFV